MVKSEIIVCKGNIINLFIFFIERLTLVAAQNYIMQPGEGGDKHLGYKLIKLAIKMALQAEIVKTTFVFPVVSIEFSPLSTVELTINHPSLNFMHSVNYIN